MPPFPRAFRMQGYVIKQRRFTLPLVPPRRVKNFCAKPQRSTRTTKRFIRINELANGGKADSRGRAECDWLVKYYFSVSPNVFVRHVRSPRAFLVRFVRPLFRETLTMY